MNGSQLPTICPCLFSISSNLQDLHSMGAVAPCSIFLLTVQMSPSMISVFSSTPLGVPHPQSQGNLVSTENSSTSRGIRSILSEWQPLFAACLLSCSLDLSQNSHVILLEYALVSFPLTLNTYSYLHILKLILKNPLKNKNLEPQSHQLKTRVSGNISELPISISASAFSPQLITP